MKQIKYIKDRADLGENLKMARKQAHLTQDFVSQVLNVDRSTISGHEIGKYAPSVFMLIELAKLYDVPLLKLLLSPQAFIDF